MSKEKKSSSQYVLQFNHDLEDVKDACGLTNENVDNFFSAVGQACDDSESFSQFIEKVERIVLSDPTYLRCAMFHMVMREAVLREKE